MMAQVPGREVHSIGQVALRAVKTLAMAAAIVIAIWALTSSTGRRFFVEWGGQQVEVTPIPSDAKQEAHY